MSDYAAFHARRYAFLLERVDEVRAELAFDTVGRGMRIIDVGPMYQTALIRQRFPEARVDSVGFAHASAKPRPGEEHVELDLEDTAAAPRLPATYHLIVCAEVIEHLRVPAERVLERLREWLEPRGSVLIQTPNVASLRRRVTLLLGRNPSDPLTGPHPHVREYTVAELLGAGRDAGLQPAGWWTRSYFDIDSAGGRLERRLGRMLPRRLRSGVTVRFRRA